MKSINRRKFIVAATSLSAISILKPGTVFGSKTNSAVRIGIIGCGGRGSEVLSNMIKETRANVIAMADLFEYQLNKAKPKFDKLNTDKDVPMIDKSKVYLGSRAWERMLNDKDVDAVLISSPAYTHPDFLKAAISSGKHAYCEKPAAPDVAGCRMVLQAGEMASGKLSLAIGFQIRHATPFVKMAERIKKGDIGEIINVQLYYFGSHLPFVPPVGKSDEEYMIRNHFHFTELSGGILLDQGVHMIDVCNWVLNKQPVSAIGRGSRKGEPDFGDTYTNYQVIYDYPEDVSVSIHSTQLGPKFGDVCARFIGTKGIAEAHYGRGVYITGENEWDSGILHGQEPTAEQRAAGVFTSALHDSTQNKVKSFIGSIETGNYINEARSGAASTMTAILGRMSAVSRKETTWDEMVDSNQKYDLKMNLSQFDK